MFQTKKYPNLSKLVKASLSIFTGPQVESSFSKMNDLIDKKSNRIDIATYDSIMTVKYNLKSKTSSEVYHRKDPLHDPVDKNICYYLRMLNAWYKKRMDGKRKNKKEVHKTIGAKVMVT